MITPKGRRQKAYEEMVPQDMRNAERVVTYYPFEREITDTLMEFENPDVKEMQAINRLVKEEDRADALNKLLYGIVPQALGEQGYQEGGPVGPPLPPQPMDPLQIGARQANPSMYEGSTLGAIRNQAMMLQNSIEQDTVNKAINSLKLMSIIDSLKQAGAGQSLDYMPMNPMPTSKADSMMARDLMEYYKMQQMKKMSQ